LTLKATKKPTATATAAPAGTSAIRSATSLIARVPVTR
jgi:hypothetical protein